MIRIQTEDFNQQAEYEALRADAPDIGAIVTFTGLVRDFNTVGDNTQEIDTLSLEHYPGMTEKVLSDIIEEAKRRWALSQVRVVHRVGDLHAADQIVFVGVSSAHRGNAFAACEFVMDFLKTQAPFWKKEGGADGSRWVEARESDSSAAAKWNKP